MARHGTNKGYKIKVKELAGTDDNTETAVKNFMVAARDGGAEAPWQFKEFFTAANGKVFAVFIKDEPDIL